MFSNRFLHKSYFKKLMLLSVVSLGRWKPERRVKERKAGRPLTFRAENEDALGWPSQAYPNGSWCMSFPDRLRAGLLCLHMKVRLW